MAEWRLIVPPGLELLSSNQRLHWAVKAKRVKALREWAGWEARRLKAPRMERVMLTVWVHPGARTRRIDQSNYHPTVKALVDGVVEAGALPDDSGRHVIAETYRLGAPWPRTSVEVLFKGS